MTSAADDTYDAPAEIEIAAGGSNSETLRKRNDGPTPPQPEILVPQEKYARLSIEQVTNRVAALVAGRFGYDAKSRRFVEFVDGEWPRDWSNGEKVLHALARIANDITLAVREAPEKERKAAAREALFLCSLGCFTSVRSRLKSHLAVRRDG